MKKLLLPILALLILAAWGGIMLCHRHTREAAERRDPLVASIETGGNTASTTAANNTAPSQLSTEAADDESGDSGSGSGADTAAAPPRAEIEQRYTSQLQSMASGYEARLNAIVYSAATEIQAAKNSGADIRPIAAKYYEAGQALEAECDSKFYPLLDQFESELQANSIGVLLRPQNTISYQ